MSFGFSLSDVVTLVALTKKTYDDWRQAPNEYADVVRTLETSELLICHVQSRFDTLSADGTNFGKPKEIGNLLRGCRDAISDLQEVARRYQNLGRWDRLRLSPSRISDCKNRLARHITVLTPYLMSLELESIGKDGISVQATLDRLPEILSNVLPAALGKMIDTRIEDSRTARGGSILTTYGDDDDKQAWKDLRKHLRFCGVNDSVVRQHRTRLVEFAKSLTCDQDHRVRGVAGGAYQMTGFSNVLSPLPERDSQDAPDVKSLDTVVWDITAKRREYQANVETGSEDADTTSVIPSPTNGGTGRSHVNYVQAHGFSEDDANVRIEDDRFKFQPDEALPMPRQFRGGPKRYKAGRGCSIPLDLSAFE